MQLLNKSKEGYTCTHPLCTDSSQPHLSLPPIDSKAVLALSWLGIQECMERTRRHNTQQNKTSMHAKMKALNEWILSTSASLLFFASIHQSIQREYTKQGGKTNSTDR
mmetsp:Transcript_14036/g.28105  ORF Transcript_14036/g.28105 Transcript_14036/m.28105 type:complete len:108 (-) Transcript_14036:887-1210(-)